MAYSEIINEIQEQIDDLQAKHDMKVLELEEIQAELPGLATQIQNLQQLKASAQDISQAVDINVNVNVNSSGSTGSTVNHAVTG